MKKSAIYLFVILNFLFANSWAQLKEAIFYAPLQLNKWMEANHPIWAEPKFKLENGQWHIIGDDDFGGYAFILKDPNIKARNISYSVKTLKFPKVKHRFPMPKKDDDFGIRIGVLLSDGKTEIAIPGKIKSELKKQGAKLSHIVYYGDSQNTKFQCGNSPHNNYSIYCLIPSTQSYKKYTHNVVLDLAAIKKLTQEQVKNIKIVGFWILSDSDQSESSIEVYMKDLKYW